VTLDVNPIINRLLTAATIVNALAAALADFTADEAGATFSMLAFQCPAHCTASERTDPLHDQSA
jgi:hypothetical protein